MRLPLRFDAEQLALEVGQFEPGEWLPHPQGHVGNSAIPLVAAGGDPSDDAARGPMAPTPFLERCQYLRQVLTALGAPIARTRLMLIEAEGEANAHVDTNYYWFERLRVHVPIVTTPEVEFVCGDERVHMAPGECWVFNTWRRHNVLNPATTARIHLVIDTVGSAHLWDLVDRGGLPEADLVVPFDPEADTSPPVEAINVPVVMSPWEQDWLVRQFLVELDDGGAAFDALSVEVRRFMREWRAQWALAGDLPTGTNAYAALLAGFDSRLEAMKGRLRFSNGTDAVEAFRQALVRPALNPDLAPSVTEAAPGSVTEAAPGSPVAAPLSAAPAAPEKRERRLPRFERPVIIVSPPRAGSSMLFETLALSPTLYSIGGESHLVFENIPGLSPAERDWESNSLSGADLTPEVAGRLGRGFWEALRDRDGNPPASDAWPVRLLEKTPKNALRIPFLDAAFPDATFVYLYRDPREEISSMLDAWRSGRFVTYPKLPDWYALPWSLLLVPGWRDLLDAPLAEIVARQWEITTRILLDDLEAVGADRWCVASYERLVADPLEEIQRICAFVDVEWDNPLTDALPLSRHTLTPPNPDKWKANAEEIEAVLPLVAATAARAREVFAHTPSSAGLPTPATPAPARRTPPVTARAVTVPTPTSPAQAARRPAASPTPGANLSGGEGAAAAKGGEPDFSSVHTQSVAQLLEAAKSSVLVSTYQSGRLIVLRSNGNGLNTHLRHFPRPMGMAFGPGGRLAMGTKDAIIEMRNQPAVAAQLRDGGAHDACYLPRTIHYSGDISIHEMGYSGEELWVVNTRFSHLCTLDTDHSFVPRWRPSFVSGLAAEDRCHLNGMAMVDGRPRFVTALGQTDTPQGWRENKATGGCLIDIDSNEVVASGLCMPHSPRWYDDRLWVLESGRGAIGTVDLETGKVETLAELPGFTRGLAFMGPYALVGLSQVRETVFGGLPLTQRDEERECGVWIVDIRTGQTAGFLRFEGIVQEIFDIQVMSGVRFPEVAEPASELIGGSFVVPDVALNEVPPKAAR